METIFQEEANQALVALSAYTVCASVCGRTGVDPREEIWTETEFDLTRSCTRLLRDAQVGQFDHRHLIQPQLAGSGQTPVPGDDAVVAVDEDRVRPAVLDDAGRDLGDLTLGVRARIAGVGNQRLDLAVLDVERVQR